MKENDILNVWYKDQLVGEIWQDVTGAIGFRYNKNWAATGFSISQKLPLGTDEFPPASRIAHSFFVNLLPEEGARNQIVKDLKITDSDFELLKEIGGECAGALSILPEKYERKPSFKYKPLNSEEFEKLLLRKGQIYNFENLEPHPRLSLAGAQNKCPIYYDGNQYYLPEGASPSSHILKFEIDAYKNVPIYECFLTELAKSIGLPAVNIELKKYKKLTYLLIERYDRYYDAEKKIQRLHQEDLCQALGISYKFKYEEKGGPTFSNCLQLIRDTTIFPTNDVENLLRWHLFNFLAGNSDAHAKNIALIYNKNFEPELAPFYDLVCTRAIEGIDHKLAFSVDGVYDPHKITLKNWDNLALSCNIQPKYLREMLFTTAKMLVDQFNVVKNIFEEKYGEHQCLQRVEKVIMKQYQKLSNKQ